MKLFVAKSGGVQGRKSGILAGAAVVVLMSGSSAFAQCAAPVQTGFILQNQQALAVPAGAAAAALGSAVSNMNTAFLSQQGSAFVSAPANPAPDQPGGGVWARAVGGSETQSSASNSTSTNTINAAGGGFASGAVINNSTTACANTVHLNYAGVQVGADIARLNWNGWNVHLGTTAGYLGANSTDGNGFANSYQVPFLGTYVVATKGRFFADLMVREDFFNSSLQNTGPVAGFPAAGNFSYFNQPVGAHGYSIATSAGYNFDLGKGWFIEPSAGFIYSDTSVDSFTNAGTTTLGIPGTISINDIKSELGRASVRVGTTVETSNIVWQPFATASVFHEFAGAIVSNYTSLPNTAFVSGAPFPPPPGTPQTFSQQTLTSRVGTYGKYSLGVAGQIVNTGWLGFVRIDYTDGSNINGWAGTAGIRYQFTPDMIAAVMPTKVPVKARGPYIAPTDWTGFYVGGFAGAADGRTGIGFVGADPTTSGAKPWVFGGLGGLELGYNRQIKNWVFGVEGDVGAANVRGGGTAGTTAGTLVGVNLVGFNPAFLTVQDRTNWMATATARVGYALGRTLYYVKGGAAFEDSTLSAACIFGPTGTLNARSCVNVPGTANTPGFNTPDYTRVGWTLGFGTEFDLGKNWSAKTEYDFLSFGSHTALASDGTTYLTDKSYISQVKVGVNYKFTPGVVVAKY